MRARSESRGRAFDALMRTSDRENIRGGVAYLAYLIRRFEGELRLVAGAYYAGEKRIQRQGLRCADADVRSGKHSGRSCIPCVFDSAVRRRAPACGRRLLCGREANPEAGPSMR